MPDQTYWFQFFIPKLYKKEAHIAELLSSRKIPRFTVRDAEFWTEISDGDFEINQVNE